MSNLKNKIEVVTNVVIVIAVVLVAGVAVKRYFFPNSETVKGSQVSQIIVGARMTIPNVNWEENKKTLVFALKNNCSHCTASAPFYKQLIDEAVKKDVKLIALVPDQLEVGRNYIQSLGLPIENIQSVSLQSFAIAGTPTVLFADNTGTVRSVWVGRVTPDREKEMRQNLVSLFDEQISFISDYNPPTNSNSINTNASQRQPSPNIEVAELKKMLDEGKEIFLIDVDEREVYKKEHIPSAKNFPDDEIQARANREVPKNKKIVVYCRCANDGTSQQIKSKLEKDGFPAVSVLKGGLEAWKKNGLAVTSAN